MSELKVHSLKETEKMVVTRLTGHKKVLVLGPLAVETRILNGWIKAKRPSAVVFVDGGLIHKKKLKASNKIFFLSIGDGDSALAAPDFILPAEKDVSDLAFALTCLKKAKVQNVDLLGFSAVNESRPDHLMFNLGEVARFSEAMKMKVQMDQFLFLPAGKTTLKLKGTFSLISLMRNSVRMTGKIRYALKEWTTLQPMSSLGLSNEGGGSMTVESKKLLILYLAGANII